MKRIAASLIALALCCSLAPAARASYITDIGYGTLQAQLGASTPTGAGVRVAQVEAPINDVSGGAAPIFMPNPSNGQFIGKTITAINGNSSGSFSGHATGVGELFYGNGSSIAPDVTQIDSYEANSWINSLSTVFGAATTSPNRVANHSWVGGSGTDPGVGTILRLVDRQVVLNEYIQVVGLTNAIGSSPLLGGSAYNMISVGRTDGVHQQGSVPVSGDSLYGTERTVPTLVAPQGSTSGATPLVAAAAAVLVQTGHEGGLTLSEGSTTIAGVGTIYNAERSETVKAALMAGADRQTANTSTDANIMDYRSPGHETANGLDSRYGAGQVNIYNSYRILAGGEQNGGSDISLFGFNYGAIGAGQTVSYFFTAPGEKTLFASLVWNLGVSNDSLLDATLHDLDLSLFDVTNNNLVTSSSGSLDNTENLYVDLLLGNRYEMRVTTKSSTPWDYALAWRIDANPAPVPIPPSAWLFATGAIGLFLATRATRARRP